MLRRIWAVIQKEIIQTVRDRSTLGMLLIMPMLQLFLFGFAIDMNVDHIPLAIADQSFDAASQAYVDAMVTSGYFDVSEYVFSQADVVQAIDEGRVQGGIVIPPDFGTNVELGQAQVLFLVDGSDLITTQTAYNMASVIAQAHAADVMMEKVVRSGLAVDGGLPLDARTRVLYNPDMSQLWFVIPNIVAMVMQTQTMAMTAAAVVREREAGTIEQILVTPIRSAELMIGKIIPNIFIAVTNVLTIVALGVFAFDVPFLGSFGLFMGLSMIYVFSGLGLGLLISTIAKNSKQSLQIIMMLMFIGIVLGGFIFPRFTMPPVLRLLGNLFPLSYFIPISRGIITKGVDITALWTQAIGMLIYSVVIMAVAARSFRQRLD
ncbi:MAG: ABC transporter permease [Chloroflexi bacterium]|nr:ABC transporter permease [Chloroflexota bacterium]